MHDPEVPKHRKKVKKKTFFVEYHISGTKKDDWHLYYKKYETLQAARSAAILLQAENDRKVAELKKQGHSWVTRQYRAKE